jgi:hypothetical protein
MAGAYRGSGARHQARRSGQHGGFPRRRARQGYYLKSLDSI